MVVFLWVMAYTLLFMSTNGIMKKVQQGIPQSFPYVVGVNLINSVFGAIAFYFIGKLHIGVDGYILGYGLIFSLFVSSCIILQLVMYSKVSVALTTLLSTCGSIITSIVYGIAFLGEPCTWQLVVAAVLLLVAAILPCRKMLSVKSGASAVVLCIVWFAIWGARAIFQNTFSNDPNLPDTNSMFFFTNTFSIGWCLILFIFCRVKYGKDEIHNMRKEVFRPKVVLTMAVNTLPSNLVTVVTVILLQLLPLSVNSIITSSMGLIGTAVLSVFIFREKLSRDNYIALVLAIIAIILKH
ncbi:MAG: hypothetical protein IKB50_02445 [Clostridia bacterium]|nr:hypothetical protein [Clostridia bacterium]